MKIGNKQIGFLGSLLILVTLASSVLAQPLTNIELTEAGMKDWFKTRIETHKIQLNIKVNASQYDDLPVAYFTARNKWLESEGKDPEKWDAYSEWVHGVYTSLIEKRELEEEKALLQSELESIDNNEYLNAGQKQMMKKGLTQVLDKREELLEPFKKDWAVAERWEEEYYELDKWLSGNLEKPPVIE